MPDNTIENSEKIEKIYQIIEFEIGNANNQLALFKKDNMNFILLILALIGFFAFIPVDVFAYNWFGNGLYVMILCAISIFLISMYLFLNPSKVKNIEFKYDCDSCDRLRICKNISDPQKKERLEKTVNFVFIENIALCYSVFYYIGSLFFISSLLTYLYLITYDPTKHISSLIQSDPGIVILLGLILLVFLFSHKKSKQFDEYESFKKYNFQRLCLSFVIIVLGILIEAYGFFLKVPSFIPISNTSQFSSTLIAHSITISSFQLSLIVTLYTLVIFLVVIEGFFSSSYVEKINEKLEELFSLKYRIDRYQLGITSEIDFEHITAKLSELRIRSPKFFTFFGIFTLTIPIKLERCEDTLYLAHDNSIGDMIKDIEK
jgi:nitrogen fixation-related uncharacterized protein